MSFSFDEFSQFSPKYNKHPIAHPGGWGMACLIWVPGPGTHIRQPIPQTPRANYGMSIVSISEKMILRFFRDKNYLLPYGSLGPTSHDCYGFQTIIDVLFIGNLKKHPQNADG